MTLFLRPDVILNIFVYFPYYLTSWRTFILFDLEAYFLYHDVLFDIMSYLLKIRRIFGVMTYFLYFVDVKMYFLYHNVRFYIMPYVLTSRRNFWRHDELFSLMTYFLS